MKVGAARIDITPNFEIPRPLLGWGDPRHFGYRAETQIYARTVAFENRKKNRIIFSCVEVCFISESLRRGVMKRLLELASTLEFQEHEVVLTATHTHNSPGGYCHSVLYNLPSQGYYPDIYELFVEGITTSILEAWRKRKICTVKVASGELPTTERVAFNRSIDAWNENHDTVKYKYSERDHALFRQMDVLTAVDDAGNTTALISWFAVHCTTVHRDFSAIHSDNKGVASLKVERSFLDRGQETIALFAQGASGDVSPNFKRYPFKNEVRGAFRDDLQSAEFNGEIQARYALSLGRRACALNDDQLDSILAHHDCTRIPIPPEWVGGKIGLTTAPAALGCPFMGGTDEGVGTPPVLLFGLELVLRLISKVYGWRIQNKLQGTKLICIDLAEGKVFGDVNLDRLPLPGAIDPYIKLIKFWSRLKVFRRQSMAPDIMPVQLFRIGSWGFAALPGEFTTQSGVRIRGLLTPLLQEMGIHHIVLAGYANSYAGYITTEEEYQLQRYEGASTHFGRYTLLGYMALYRQLAEKWLNRPAGGRLIPEKKPPSEKASSYLRKLKHSLYSRLG